MKNRSILLLAALFFTAAGCSPKTGGKPDVPAGTPVIVISIDTLRADRLPAYGYKGVETPALDELVKDSILYERAYTVTPLTLPAHSTLLTGVLPAVHTVRDNVGYRLDTERIEKGELPFLPQILKKKGYATGGAISAYVLQGKSGLSTGFDFYEDSIEFRTGTGLGGLQRPGGETLRVSLDWLRSVADKPFFYFFHIYEPHTPYAPPERFASYSDKYDGEVAASDAIVGELLEELKRLDVYDKALIVLLSDHGEGLGDHGEDEHGVFLYHEAIHVPLFLKLPESQLGGTRAAAPVQLMDVAPTVLSLLGEAVPEPLKGASLVDLLAPQAPVRRIYSETFYPRLHFGWSELSSLIDGEHHYIEGPDPELYDVVRDPQEKTNILQQERRTYAALRKEIEGYDRDLAPPSAVDEETRQAMTALGYIGGSGGGAGDGPLPDPKTRIGSLADLKNGVQLLGSDNHSEAAEAFRRVIAQNPKMVDAWEFLGRALQKSGRVEEALAAYREALEISGGSPHIAVAAGSLYFDLGQLDEAEKHARLAVAMNPSFAHGLLAQVALQREKLDEAEKEARLAMEDESFRVGPMITLAEVLHARKDLQGALELTRKAEEVWNEREGKEEDLLRGLYVIRGKVLADLGDAPAAEAAFHREIELFPDSLRAYSSLALLYALTGRGEQVGPTLKSMVDSNPNPLAYAEAVKALRVMNDRAAASSLLRFALGRYPDSTVLQGLARTG